MSYAELSADHAGLMMTRVSGFGAAFGTMTAPYQRTYFRERTLRPLRGSLLGDALTPGTGVACARLRRPGMTACRRSVNTPRSSSSANSDSTRRNSAGLVTAGVVSG
jgi:hypothetical protein